MKTKAPFLVDANALIALTWQTHEHHRAAAEWVASVTSFAICPIVEGAVVAALEAAMGASLDELEVKAGEARHTKKLME